jgi:hypothetical protein
MQGFGRDSRQPKGKEKRKCGFWNLASQKVACLQDLGSMAKNTAID